MQFLTLTLFWFCGIWAASTISIPYGGWLTTAAVSLPLAIFFWRNYRYYAPQLAFTLACLASLALGAARWHMAQPVIDATHIAYYNDQTNLTIHGRTIAQPDIRDRAVNLRLRTTHVTLPDGSRHEVRGDILIQTPRFPIIPYGTELRVYGNLDTPTETPEFSYRDYLATQGVHSTMRWPRILEQTPDRGSPIYHAIYAAKGNAQQTIQQLIPEPSAGLLSGILLGIGHATPPAVDEDFRTVGITHIVVISGFNISILSAIFLNLLTPFMGRKPAAYGAIAMIVLYTIMVGADPSVVRAAIMGSIFVLADRLLGRRNASIVPLFVAAWFMTLHDPLALWHVGFQLSFAATLSLMLYAEPLTQKTRHWLSRRFDHHATQTILSLITDAALVTIAAQVLTLPLLMAYFQQLSLISLVANFFVLPAQPAVMILGGLATLLGMIWFPLGQPFAWAATLFLQYTIRTAALFAQVPHAMINVSYPVTAMLFTYVVIGAWTWLAKQEPERKVDIIRAIRHRLGLRLSLSSSALCFLLAGQWAITQPDGLLHVVFFDVGQGDAIFIQTPSGRQILIDGGYYPTVLHSHLGRTMPFGDRQLDMLIATHPDADHISGLPELFNRYTIEQLLVSELPDPANETSDSPIYEALLTAAADQQTTLIRPVAGETILIEDGVRLEIVHPTAVPLPDGRNDNSISIRLIYHDFSLLLTGDAEVAGENSMLASGLPLQSLIFKAGHHGANNASTAPFLAAVRPQIMIVSSGIDNRFGHPHPDMLARAAAVNATVLRTDQLGTITVKTDGRQTWWTAQK